MSHHFANITHGIAHKLNFITLSFQIQCFLKFYWKKLLKKKYIYILTKFNIWSFKNSIKIISRIEMIQYAEAKLLKLVSHLISISRINWFILRTLKINIKSNIKCLFGFPLENRRCAFWVVKRSLTKNCHVWLSSIWIASSIPKLTVDQKLWFGASAFAKIDSQFQFCFSNHLPLLPFIYNCPPWQKTTELLFKRKKRTSWDEGRN